MTADSHTADTEYTGYHPDHQDVPASIEITPKPPAPPRPWPFAARLAVAVLVILLAAATVVSYAALQRSSARLTVSNAAASHQAASQQSAIAGLRGELAAQQAQLAAIAPAIGKLGFCEATFTNNATGLISSISLSPPGVGDKCTNGQFISVVPPHGAPVAHNGGGS